MVSSVSPRLFHWIGYELPNQIRTKNTFILNVTATPFLTSTAACVKEILSRCQASGGIICCEAGKIMCLGGCRSSSVRVPGTIREPGTRITTGDASR
jgi:hypothetical protein